MMRYENQLKTPQWKIKRQQILFRDGKKCTHCGKKTKHNIHHTVYIKGRYAWEYENDDLITLCQPCHEKEHQKVWINVEEGDEEDNYYYKSERKRYKNPMPKYRDFLHLLSFRMEQPFDISVELSEKRFGMGDAYIITFLHKAIKEKVLEKRDLKGRKYSNFYYVNPEYSLFPLQPQLIPLPL